MSGREPLWRRYARFVRDDIARDVDDELRFHLDALIAEEIAAGSDPESARRRAQARMGDLNRARAEGVGIRRRGAQREGRARWFRGWGQDLRFVIRGLRRAPLFTLVASLTLALGIGATTAVFSVLDGSVLRPLPYGDPAELVMLWEHNLVRNRPRNVANPHNALDWKARTSSLASMAIMVPTSMIFTGDDGAERVTGRAVTPNFFDVLQVRPALGRTFVDADSAIGAVRGRSGGPEVDTPNAAPSVLVLSHRMWQRHFGGDSSVVGRLVPVAGGSALVAGVMPPAFRPLGGEEFWMAMSLPAATAERHGRSVLVLARLADNATLGQARAELQRVAQALEHEHPAFNSGWTVNVVPLHEDVLGDARGRIYLAMGAVCLVLLIACANVGNLLLVRAAARAHEMTLRAALGAGRGRLARLWLAEGVVLSGIGVGLGLLIAWVGVHSLTWLAPPDVPRLENIRIDARVFAFGAILATGVAITLGLVAALGVPNDAGASLRASETRHSAGAQATRFRHTLVVGQVALALVLLHAAGLLLRTLDNLERVDPGFDPAQVVTGNVVLPTALYREPASWTRFFREAVARLRSEPGVTAAGFVNAIPLTGLSIATTFRALDREEPAAGQWPVADIRIASEGYFEALSLTLHRGRLLREGDDTLPRVVVNDVLVRQLWPGGDPIGQRLLVNFATRERPVTIVGVVRSTRTERLDEQPRAMIYYAPEAVPLTGHVLVVKGGGGAATLTGALRRVVGDLDPVVALRDVGTMRATIDRSLADRRSPGAAAQSARRVGVGAGNGGLVRGVGVRGRAAGA